MTFRCLGVGNLTLAAMKMSNSPGYPLFVFCEVPDIEHLCEKKHCQLEEFINKEMNRLRTEGQLCLTVLPL